MHHELDPILVHHIVNPKEVFILLLRADVLVLDEVREFLQAPTTLIKKTALKPHSF
jgi:hypothetical protein